MVMIFCCERRSRWLWILIFVVDFIYVRLMRIRFRSLILSVRSCCFWLDFVRVWFRL